MQRINQYCVPRLKGAPLGIALFRTLLVIAIVAGAIISALWCIAFPPMDMLTKRVTILREFHVDQRTYRIRQYWGMDFFTVDMLVLVDGKEIDHIYLDGDSPKWRSCIVEQRGDLIIVHGPPITHSRERPTYYDVNTGEWGSLAPDGTRHLIDRGRQAQNVTPGGL